MSDHIIPLEQMVPWYTFRITLAAVRYTLELRYNIRMARWILNIMNANGDPILMGAPLLIQRRLTQYPARGLPPGDMFVVDNSGKGTQPTLSSFLTDHQLIYGDP